MEKQDSELYRRGVSVTSAETSLVDLVTQPNQDIKSRGAKQCPYIRLNATTVRIDQRYEAGFDCMEGWSQ